MLSLYLATGISLAIVLAVAGVVLLYVAYPYRGVGLPRRLRWVTPALAVVARLRVRAARLIVTGPADGTGSSTEPDWHSKEPRRLAG